MKNIAVLVYELTIEYNSTVLTGIIDYFDQKKDVRLVISPVNIPNAETSEFDYQYWSSVDVLCSEEIDAYIVIANSFTVAISLEKLSEYLKVLAQKPVISVGAPLNIENNIYTKPSCEEAYEQIIQHLVKKHNKTKIGFFTAGLSFSEDSTDRFNAYKKALANAGLEYNEDFIFHGDFTPGVAETEFLKRIKSKEDVKFEALLCANDYTAVGVLAALNKLGVKCPEEVILFGFDDTDIALATCPTLSTVNQDVVGTGAAAAAVAYDVVNGKQREKKIETFAKTVFRQSCGCVKSIARDDSYYDNDGIMHTANEYRSEQQKFYLLGSSNFTTIYGLLNSVDTNNDFKLYLQKLLNDFKLRAVTEISIVMYKYPIEIEKSEIFKVPNEVYYVFYSSKYTKTQNIYLDNQIAFNPKKEIIPREYSDCRHGPSLLIPIYNKKQNLGYIMFRFEGHNYPVMSIYGKILANSIFQACQNTKNFSKRKELMMENHKLNIKSKTDELTGVLNRRGFYDYGQKLISLSTSMGKTGCVLFFDLDGLKTINDTYGHKIGDLAVKVESQVLKAAFRETDVVGRLSGDEFGVVAPGFPSRKVSALREKLIVLNEEFSKKNELPFTLSISVGCVDFFADNNDIQLLLKSADENLYQEKRIKHSQK